MVPLGLGGCETGFHWNGDCLTGSAVGNEPEHLSLLKAEGPFLDPRYVSAAPANSASSSLDPGLMKTTPPLTARIAGQNGWGIT